jgi:hypothetical protein
MHEKGSTIMKSKVKSATKATDGGKKTSNAEQKEK